MIGFAAQRLWSWTTKARPERPTGRRTPSVSAEATSTNTPGEPEETAAVTYRLYETWESHEDLLNVQIRRPYWDAWHEALPRLLKCDRDIEIWELLRSDHR